MIINKPFKNLKYNKVNILAILKKSKLLISGKYNVISIKKGNLKKISIGVYGDNNNVIIESNSHIRNLNIMVIGNNHSVYIGQRVNIGESSIVCCGQDSGVHIGDDCLLASNINFKSCDGHAIYKNNEIINNSEKIIISDRVWIAQDVNILKGVEISCDSVVGINSLLTANKYPSNVIIGGVPAKILNTGITWSRKGTL